VVTPDISEISESVAEQLAELGLDCIVTVSDGESIAVNYAYSDNESLAIMQSATNDIAPGAHRVN
jgi:hypothetical protein